MAINFSVVNLILLLLLIRDVFTLRNIEDYAVSFANSPSKVKHRTTFCSRKESNSSRANSSSSRMVLLQSNPAIELHVNLHGTNSHSYWASLLPKVSNRFAIYWCFAFLLVVRLVGVVVDEPWLQQTPTWAHFIVYLVNGGFNQYHNVFVEYALLIFTSLCCHVSDRCAFYVE